MWRKKLCLGTSRQFGSSVSEQILLFKKIGFDGFFTGWQRDGRMDDWAKLARNEGMLYQSVHAPFQQVHLIWRESSEGDAVIDDLISCATDCARCGVPVMVSHVFIGFTEHTPTPIGVERFGRLAVEAGKLGVTVAFENTEGMEYLAAVMDGLRGVESARFCWDTGHELCYNYSQDMMALYGDRLAATHFNDNLGIRDFGGEITWCDDLHLLPFDGITDWDSVGRRVKACGYSGPLTFELNITSKPDRLENDVYRQMPLGLYLTEAYKRACRLAAKCL